MAIRIPAIDPGFFALDEKRATKYVNPIRLQLFKRLLHIFHLETDMREQ